MDLPLEFPIFFKRLCTENGKLDYSVLMGVWSVPGCISEPINMANYYILGILLRAIFH